MENRIAVFIGLLVVAMFVIGTVPVHAQSKNTAIQAKASQVKAFIKQKILSLKTGLQGKLANIRVFRSLSKGPAPVSISGKRTKK